MLHSETNEIQYLVAKMNFTFDIINNVLKSELLKSECFG